MSNDVVITPVSRVPTGGVVKISYPHLIKLRDVVGSKVNYSLFLTIEQPNLENNYIKVKGIFVSESEEELSLKLNEKITNLNRDDIVEIVLPWTRVDHIKNLLFKAK